MGIKINDAIEVDEGLAKFEDFVIGVGPGVGELINNWTEVDVGTDVNEVDGSIEIDEPSGVSQTNSITENTSWINESRCYIFSHRAAGTLVSGDVADHRLTAYVELLNQSGVLVKQLAKIEQNATDLTPATYRCTFTLRVNLSFSAGNIDIRNEMDYFIGLSVANQKATFINLNTTILNNGSSTGIINRDISTSTISIGANTGYKIRVRYVSPSVAATFAAGPIRLNAVYKN